MLSVVVVLCSGLAGAGVGLAARTGTVRPLGWGALQRPAGLPVDAARRPFAVPAPPPAGQGGYRVLHTMDDGSHRPVRWDPCRPVHYVVRTAGEPPGGARAVALAVAEVARATGLRFVYDGETGEKPVRDRPTMDPDRYGRRWSPVLVAWTDPQEYPDMAGYAGLGGPSLVAGDEPGSQRYVTGVVLLNRVHLRDVVRWDGGAGRLTGVVRHEFGHLVGLDHVEDPRELMFSRPDVVGDDFADGDRRGLAALGGGPCFRDF